MRLSVTQPASRVRERAEENSNTAAFAMDGFDMTDLFLACGVSFAPVRQYQNNWLYQKN